MTLNWQERTAPPPKRQASFVAREIARKGHLVQKLKAKDSTGRWAYYYLLVEPYREKAFLAALEGDGVIDIEHYGRVLASNYGEEPSAATLKFLKDTYGFDE